MVRSATLSYYWVWFFNNFLFKRLNGVSKLYMVNNIFMECFGYLAIILNSLLDKFLDGLVSDINFVL